MALLGFTGLSMSAHSGMSFSCGWQDCKRGKLEFIMPLTVSAQRLYPDMVG